MRTRLRLIAASYPIRFLKEKPIIAFLQQLTENEVFISLIFRVIVY